MDLYTCSNVAINTYSSPETQSFFLLEQSDYQIRIYLQQSDK